MSRELIESLNKFCVCSQGYDFKGTINPNDFKQDILLNDLHREITFLIRRDLFITPHAINIKTIDLLLLCGFSVAIDAQKNLYVTIPAGRLKVLNPLEIAKESFSNTEVSDADK